MQTEIFIVTKNVEWEDFARTKNVDKTLTENFTKTRK